MQQSLNFKHGSPRERSNVMRQCLFLNRHNTYAADDDDDDADADGDRASG